MASQISINDLPKFSLLWPVIKIYIVFFMSKFKVVVKKLCKDERYYIKK